jgi:hypothetical protein
MSALLSEEQVAEQLHVSVASLRRRERCRTRLVSHSQDVARKQFHPVEKEWDLEPQHLTFFAQCFLSTEMVEVDDLQRKMVALMQKTKICPKLIDAYLRTGQHMTPTL